MWPQKEDIVLSAGVERSWNYVCAKFFRDTCYKITIWYVIMKCACIEQKMLFIGTIRVCNASLLRVIINGVTSFHVQA